MNKIIFITIVFISGLVFTACSTTTIEDQKEMCIKEGKKFKTERVLNLRSGEYEIKGKCL